MFLCLNDQRILINDLGSDHMFMLILGLVLIAVGFLLGLTIIGWIIGLPLLIIGSIIVVMALIQLTGRAVGKGVKAGINAAKKE